MLPQHGLMLWGGVCAKPERWLSHSSSLEPSKCHWAGCATGITPGRITLWGWGARLPPPLQCASVGTGVLDASTRRLARCLCPPRARCCSWREEEEALVPLMLQQPRARSWHS